MQVWRPLRAIVRIPVVGSLLITGHQPSYLCKPIIYVCMDPANNVFARVFSFSLLSKRPGRRYESVIFSENKQIQHLFKHYLKQTSLILSFSVSPIENTHLACAVS